MALAGDRSDDDEATARKKGRQSDRYKKVCITDPDATMATSSRSRAVRFVVGGVVKYATGI